MATKNISDPIQEYSTEIVFHLMYYLEIWYYWWHVLVIRHIQWQTHNPQEDKYKLKNRIFPDELRIGQACIIILSYE